MNREKLFKIAKPIIFSTEMVQAILDNRKSVTRRVIKPQPDGVAQGNIPFKYKSIEVVDNGILKTISHQENEPHKRFIDTIKLRYKVGDILYVRETYTFDDYDGFVDYRADFTDEEAKNLNAKWKPSIHMPKSIARIFLEVTDVRVERLRDIAEEQAIKEGVKDPYDYMEPWFYERPSMQGLEYHIAAFAGLWFSTLPRYYQDYMTWEGNPWVEVVEFERVKVEG